MQLLSCTSREMRQTVYSDATRLSAELRPSKGAGTLENAEPLRNMILRMPGLRHLRVAGRTAGDLLDLASYLGHLSCSFMWLRQLGASLEDDCPRGWELLATIEQVGPLWVGVMGPAWPWAQSRTLKRSDVSGCQQGAQHNSSSAGPPRCTWSLGAACL